MTITLPGTAFSNFAGNSSNGLNWEFTLPPGTLSNLSGVVPALQQILFKGKDADGHDLMDLRGMSNELSSCVQLPGLIDCGSWAGGYQSGFDDVHIFEVGCLILTLNVPSPAGTSGFVTMSIAGGASPYKISWQGPGSTLSWTWNSNIIQLPYSSPGTYNVVVSSGIGCISSKIISIPSCPIPFEINTSYFEPACPGEKDGKICVEAVLPSNVPVVSNPQFNFSWSGGTSYSNGNISCVENISNDVEYCVTVTELTCNQSQVKCYSLKYSEQMIVYFSIKPACGIIPSGRIQLNVFGGKPIHSFEWSVPGQTSATLNNVPAGNYCVSITDACGSIYSNCYDVPPFDDNNTIQVSQTIIPSCSKGISTGAIQLNVTGTPPPFSYLWNNGSTQSFIDGIPAGSYSVSVTDVCGKTVVKSYTVGQYNGPAISLASSGPDCSPSPGQGFLNISVSSGYGAYAAYNFLWSGGQTTEDISGLNSGSHTVTVTDGRGCPASSTFQVAYDGFSVPGFSMTPDTCGQGVGAITITAVSNPLNVPYSIAWSNGGSGMSIQELYAGNYSITATNTNGCTYSGTYSVTNENPKIILVNLTHPTPGGANGAINISVSGGVPPDTFLWVTFSNTGWPGATTEDISGIPNGHYMVKVTDAAGCTSNENFFLNATQPISLNLSPFFGNGITPCFQTSNGVTLQYGAIDLNVNGGCGTLTYSWSGPPGFVPPYNSQDLTGLYLPGQYCVTVTDVCGNVKTKCIVLTCDCSSGATPSALFKLINPCLDNGLYDDGTADIELDYIYTSGGSYSAIFYIQFIKNGTVFQTGIVQGAGSSWVVLSGTDKVEVGSGSYTVEVTNEFGCKQVFTYTVHKPHNTCISYVPPFGSTLISHYLIPNVLPGVPEDKLLYKCSKVSGSCGDENGIPTGDYSSGILKFFPCDPMNPCNSGGVLQCTKYCGFTPVNYLVPPGVGGQLIQVTENTCGCIFPAGSINHYAFLENPLPIYGELSKCENPQIAGDEFTYFCGGDFEPPRFECPEECNHCKTIYEKESCSVEIQCFDQSGSLLEESTQIIDDYFPCRKYVSCLFPPSVDIFLQCNQNECDLFYLGYILAGDINSLYGDGIINWLEEAWLENVESVFDCDAYNESEDECLSLNENICSFYDLPICGCEVLVPLINEGSETESRQSMSNDTEHFPTLPPAVEFSSRVYPNPFTSSVTIKVYLPADGDIEARFYDVFGREMAYRTFTGKKGGNQLVLDTNGKAWYSNLYYLRISDSHGNTESHKLVKAGW